MKLKSWFHLTLILSCLNTSVVLASQNKPPNNPYVQMNAEDFGPTLLTNQWFFTGQMGHEYGASLRKAQDFIVHVGQVFGFTAIFLTNKDKVNVRVALELPYPAAERFPSHTGVVTITPDKRIVVVDYEVLGSKEYTSFYWGIGPGDPIGFYKLGFLIDGEPGQVYQFEVK